MYQNWIIPKEKMQSTIKELLDVLGCNVEVDAVLSYVQNDPNYGNYNLSSKQVNEYAQRLALKSSNTKMFLKKYEELKTHNTNNLPELIATLYKLVCEEKRAKISKPKVAPKPVLGESKHHITKDDLPQIKDKLLKAVDESKKLVMKSFEEKDSSKIRPNWFGSLDLPSWHLDNPSMSWDFPKEELPIVASLAGIPIASQEHIIIEELLYILSGVPGNHIVHDPVANIYEKRTFTISEDLDDALRQIVQQMLPLASNYSIIRGFIENSNMWSGQVLHALVAAIEILLKDYYMMIAQLETGKMAGSLTIQKLWYYVLPTMHTMHVLASIVATIGKSELRGGAVLTVLHERFSLMGDARAQEVLLFLTERACRPFLAILDQWIHKGNIVDRFQEFMIEDNELINKEVLPVDYSADYWEKRYCVENERVPKFLDKFTDIILRTGKYLNVISQCGKYITKTNTEEIKYSLQEQNYGAIIQRAYSFASKSLLELLLKEYDLMGRLKSVKNYFLMCQGDFIVQFMDATEQELSKKIDDIVPSKLESLLGLCLRLSAARHDPYSEDMRVELLPYDLQFQMFKILSIETEEENEYKQNKDAPLTGIETFSFGMDVKWPVSLILNHKAIACYQMIFRHLFYCKHVERLLNRVWRNNQVVKRFAEGRLYSAAFALRQRMLGCIQHLQYYMCVEVLEPSWSHLVNTLQAVNNVDEVLERHNDFLESCLADCMLTSPQLLKAVTTLCAVCVQFCTFIQEMHKHFVDAELNSMLETTYDNTDYGEGSGCGGGSNEGGGGAADSFARSVSRYGLRFTAALLSVLAIVERMARDNNNNKLLNISSRLNFNTYYAKELEKFCADEKLMEGDKRRSTS